MEQGSKAMVLTGLLAVLSFAVGAMALWTVYYVASLRRGIRLKVAGPLSEKGTGVRTRITVTNVGVQTEEYVVVLIFVAAREDNPVECDIMRSSGMQPLRAYELERETDWASLTWWSFVYAIENMHAKDTVELELRSHSSLTSVRMIATASEITDSYSRPVLFGIKNSKPGP
jgi:hypothetical protein